MWEVSNNAQVISFLISVLFGIGYAIYYSFFKALRKVKRYSPAVIFFQDIIFFLTIAFITFFMLLALSNGEVRFFLMFGILAGFCLFYFTFSRFLTSFLSLIFKVLIKAKKAVLRIVSKVFGFFIKTGGTFAAFLEKKSRNLYKYLKNILKGICNMVYTKGN